MVGSGSAVALAGVSARFVPNTVASPQRARGALKLAAFTIPPGEIWVHCQAGYRAAVAASLLDAAGVPVVLVNDEFARAQQAGLARAEP